MFGDDDDRDPLDEDLRPWLVGQPRTTERPGQPGPNPLAAMRDLGEMLHARMAGADIDPDVLVDDGDGPRRVAVSVLRGGPRRC